MTEDELISLLMANELQTDDARSMPVLQTTITPPTMEELPTATVVLKATPEGSLDDDEINAAIKLPGKLCLRGKHLPLIMWRPCVKVGDPVYIEAKFYVPEISD
jgi:hypothetical protein